MKLIHFTSKNLENSTSVLQVYEGKNARLRCKQVFGDNYYYWGKFSYISEIDSFHISIEGRDIKVDYSQDFHMVLEQD